ncbi:hypothetical protein [Thermosphaera aggregans]|jgi:asparagine N-glycosylation enzyme membrane subunit Stt3|uniref:Uncharacterized protein n=1 Tax=Thermosphaera aggregans (strain DSM 11486 / M11TL) TaxID=633148 RepID=D5U080_THEAM|nr:hypothetical protein [Thermosphaera aggregans]ADG90530.1 hypothetical protein Tagg_0250 [Thermosphaera aggregans DSM 11486]
MPRGEGVNTVSRHYIGAGIFLILLMYVIPYAILQKVKDASLFTYWTILSLIWIIVSIIYLYKWVRE